MTDTPETAISAERPDPRLIQELFDKDPLELSDQDIDLIILDFRLDRANYLQPKAPKEPKSKKASASKESSAETVPMLPGLSLEDLGLELK